MTLGKIKNCVACALILGVLGFGNVESAFALEPSDPIPECSQKILESNLTIAQIENIFLKYLDENNIDLKRGTPEYFNFIFDQMLYGTDKNLKNHPDYDLITAYFVEYILDYENQTYQPTKRSTRSNINTVNLQNKDKTVAQIRKESIEEDTQLQSSEEDTQLQSSNDENSPKVVRRIAGYNAIAARNYAYRNYNTQNKAYNYYGSNGGDCTNFVSQCLYAGGMKETIPSRVPNGINGTSSYWYSLKPNVSTAWIRVADFHSYWAPKVPDANYEGDTTVSRNGKVGDVVQIRYAGTLKRWHTMIITKKDSKQVYLSGHTTNRKDHPISSIDDNANDWTLLDF